LFEKQISVVTVNGGLVLKQFITINDPHKTVNSINKFLIHLPFGLLMNPSIDQSRILIYDYKSLLKIRSH